VPDLDADDEAVQVSFPSGTVAMDQRTLLPEGRQLGWRVWGDPEGRPLLRLQGTPGSRLSIPPHHQEWADRHLRVIMADRPGFGLSTRLAERSILDVADDYAVLLDQLQLDSVAVLGISGGGPHALAFAFRYPERVLALSIVAGVPPLRDDDLSLLPKANATSYLLAKHGWAALHRFTERERDVMLADPVAGLRASMIKAPLDDQRIMSEPSWQQAHNMGVREALRQGAEGWTDEVMAILSPWQFAPEQVRPPVTWWAGEADINCPIAAVRRYVDRLPSAQLHVWEGAGHLRQYLRPNEFMTDLTRRAFDD
jgi:pimeloyl-ACP methyl ester carboxylesterase